jgi:YegS/Rv2252/BmrU family lipid kinase
MAEAVAILNPQAAGGSVRRRWPEYEKAIRRRIPHLEVRWSERPWHAAELTQQALEQGAERIIAVGGDGTLHEAVNGFLSHAAAGAPRACLGYLPMGTGGDFQRTLRAPTDPESAAAYLAEARVAAIDVGRVRFLGTDDATVSQRYFVNLLSFGMGGDVSVAAKDNIFCKINGKAAFLWATLQVFFRYPGKSVDLEFDGEETLRDVDITNVAVGNGQYHGGGMHPCPQASLTSGLLDVTIIDHLSWFELLRDLPVLYSDAIYKHPKVRWRKVRRLVARSADIVRAEVDGEAAGALPLEIAVLPGVLPLLWPAERRLP